MNDAIDDDVGLAVSSASPDVTEAPRSPRPLGTTPSHPNFITRLPATLDTTTHSTSRLRPLILTSD